MLVVFVIGAAGLGIAFRQGLVPAQLSPLPVVDLAEPDGWLIDWRLAELKRDRALCERALRSPFIDAQPVADQPIADGCGWQNAVRIDKLSGARLGGDKLSCQSAAALALWVAHDVQPLAREILGSDVATIRQWGTYACRNVAGNALFKHWRSAHATANAIDITGFVLSDGRQIAIKKDWKGNGKEGQFLKAVHRRACRYFHVAIGPDYNAAHHDHFHFDRGIGHACR